MFWTRMLNTKETDKDDGFQREGKTGVKRKDQDMYHNISEEEDEQ